MDYFLDYLIKKSDLNNNEYFNYNQSSKNKEASQQLSKSPRFAGNKKKLTYNKVKEPMFSSYVVFDFETTGVSRFNDKLLEIGAVKVNDDIVVDKFSTLINPMINIPYRIQQLCCITNDMVANAPKASDAIADFLTFIGDLPLVAHNAPFDIGFLIENASRININISNPVVDTLWLSRHYNAECEKHNLAYLTNYFNIKLDNAHRAYYDALATNELYQIIRNKYLKLK